MASSVGLIMIGKEILVIKKTLANLFNPWFDGFPPHRNAGESCLPSYNGQITLNDVETPRLLDLI